MQVFVTGGTGLIGSRLIHAAPDARRSAGGVDAALRGRRRQMLGPDCQIVEGDPMKPGDWQDAAADCDAVVNLAGENLFKHRWNAAFKALMTDSRIQSTQHVVAALARKPSRGDGQRRKYSSTPPPSAITARTATRS